jgi:hypothetical protein
LERSFYGRRQRVDYRFHSDKSRLFLSTSIRTLFVSVKRQYRFIDATMVLAFQSFNNVERRRMKSNAAADAGFELANEYLWVNIESATGGACGREWIAAVPMSVIDSLKVLVRRVRRQSSTSAMIFTDQYGCPGPVSLSRDDLATNAYVIWSERPKPFAQNEVDLRKQIWTSRDGVFQVQWVDAGGRSRDVHFKSDLFRLADLYALSAGERSRYSKAQRQFVAAVTRISCRGDRRHKNAAHIA